MNDQQLAVALTQAARTIDQARSEEETLQAIAETALTLIPGIEHAGVSLLDRGGRPRIKAATSDLVCELDKIQYALHEGPCVDILRSATMVAAPCIRNDPRWPNYAPMAADHGLKAELAVPLLLDGQRTVGGLILYSTVSERIDAQTSGVADLFATHASLALGRACEVKALNEALCTRGVISQAVGILMARYMLNPDAAFGLLVRAASHSNTKVRDIAAQMVEKHIADASGVTPPM